MTREGVFRDYCLSVLFRSASLSEEEVWFGVVFSDAETEATGCGVHGGRYWEVTLDLRKLYEPYQMCKNS